MRVLPFAALALLYTAPAVRADTITNFNFSSDLTDGYTAQGLVSIDTTDGQVESSFFTLTQNGLVDATFSQPEYSEPTSGAYLATFADTTDGYTYEMLLPNSTLIGYQGGSVCTVAHTCLGYPSGVYLPNGGDEMGLDGTLTPTPEPGSLILLATGIALGLLFRRSRAGSPGSPLESMHVPAPGETPALPGSVP